MMSESLLGSGFTVEVHNITTSDGIEEVKTFSSFIPTTFTQSEYDHYIQEVNQITSFSSTSTVVDDFNRIGEVTATFISHPDSTDTTNEGTRIESEGEITGIQEDGEVSNQLTRSRKGCFVRIWPPTVGCETNPDRDFGVGLEADLSGIHVVVRYKIFRLRIRVLSWGKRRVQSKRHVQHKRRVQPKN